LKEDPFFNTRKTGTVGTHTREPWFKEEVYQHFNSDLDHPKDQLLDVILEKDHVDGIRDPNFV